ncbi:MAG TPA: hypothetical protein VLS85_06085 [Hanamia sp.]|nr:hypothetical protein [Hanamia sp.]
MKHKSKLFVCLLLLWIIGSHNGYAQIRDSLNSPEGAPIQQFQQENSDSNTVDTALQKKLLKDNTQIIKWKQSREFSYMHYLDSLLRKQKDLRTDTVSIDEKSGRINRTHQRERRPSPLNMILNSWPLKLFFWALALIFIVFITYKVFFKNGIFVRREKIIKESDEESLQELNEVSAYDTLIAEAENSEQFNLATRYLFLKTLKNLSDRGLINFTAEKTNKEYLKEMEPNNYFDEFRGLTRNYEYTWYGKFPIDKEEYQILKEEFDSFNKKI